MEGQWHFYALPDIIQLFKHDLHKAMQTLLEKQSLKYLVKPMTGLAQ